MNPKLKVLGICGSASPNSANLSILKYIANQEAQAFEFELIDDLKGFPHFNTEQTDNNVPEPIQSLRNKVVEADGIIFCSPEYVFSIPSGLKNILEWCVSTTVFSDKPVGIITASASGEKGHQELQMILKTIQTRFNEGTTLLIKGVKGKVAPDGSIKDEKTVRQLAQFVVAFKDLIRSQP